MYNPATGQYEPLRGVDQGFCNYTLVPEKRYVISSMNDGYQYGETKIYQWHENTLALLRSATVANVYSTEYDEDSYTERWDFSRYELIVYDHTQDEQSGQIIYHETYPDDDPQFEAHRASLDAALWEGL